MRALEAEVVDVIWKAIQPLASTRSLTAVRDPARTQQIVATSGWKWSVAVERHGIPIGWTIDGANRHDTRLLEPRRGSTTKHVTQPITLQLRWIVEALNSWWSNDGHDDTAPTASRSTGKPRCASPPPC
ncbi:MAG: hypothetical protein H0W46_00990 [Acidimicrobiia bacterium]|nr:hypothetical protein [Acidimicrobiia bacterium]